MRRSLPALLLALWLVAASAVADEPKESQPGESVVVVVALHRDGSGGTGTGVMTDLGILTAAHVVRDAVAVYAKDRTGRIHRPDSWVVISGGDAARLTFREAPPIPALPVGTLRHPRHVRCIGTWGRAREDGYLVDVHGTAWPTDARHGEREGWIHSSVPLSKGMSGSPLLDGRTVVGLASMRNDADDYTVFSAVGK